MEGDKVGLAYVLRNYFNDSDEGNKIIDGGFVAFSEDSNDNDNLITPRDGTASVEIKIKCRLY